MFTVKQAEQLRDDVSAAIEGGQHRDVSAAYLGIHKLVEDAQNDAENTRMAMFGRGVVSILDGQEWDGHAWSAISDLAEALNITFADPYEADDDEDPANS